MKSLNRMAGLASTIQKNVDSHKNSAPAKGLFGIQDSLVEPAMMEPWSSLGKGSGKVE